MTAALPATAAPPLLEPRPEKIPELLRAVSRWAPWRAAWNATKGKYDKMPVHPVGYGLSTKRPEAWVTFDSALAAYQRSPKSIAGVGYVMTGVEGLVALDLDRCVEGNRIAPWAEEIVNRANSYTELSPSGNGLRVFVQGEIPNDWTRHDVGLEIYAGRTARFLTVTGHRLKKQPEEVRQATPGFFKWLATEYPPAARTDVTEVAQMPDLVDVLPRVTDLQLSPQAMDFLTDGTTGADRSRTLFATAVDMLSSGLDEATVLSLLADNEHAMAIALDHRRQDHDRALAYLWTEHCQKAKGKAAPKVATSQDFEDLSPRAAKSRGLAVAAAGRFAFEDLADVVTSPTLAWTIKRVLPEQGVGAVFGPSKSGKSFLVFDMCMAIVRGVPWRDRKVKAGTVAYIVAEGAGGVPNRVRAYCDYHGIEPRGLPLKILRRAAPNLLQKQDVLELTQTLRQCDGLRLVVVDTLAQTTPGANENSSEDMGRALAHCKALAEATNTLVLLVGHTGKDEAKGLRGWSGQTAAFDVEIQVEQSGEYRAATITKMKDGRDGEEFPFELETVVLGQDEDGDEITSCIVRATPGGLRAQRRAQPKGAVQKLVMRVASALLDLPGDVNQVHLVDAVVAEMPAPEAGKRDQRRNHAMRAIEGLVGIGALSLAGGAVTLPGGL